jgi:uncharacterized membrane protein (DUF485 family)
MDSNFNPQTLQVKVQTPTSNKSTLFIVVGIMALVIALILDYIYDRQAYISPYQNWMFVGNLLIYILEVCILYGILKLFKILDTSFNGRIIFVGLSSLAFDVMQYVFLPKVGKGDIIALTISLIVFFVILFSLTKNIYKTGTGKTIGLSLIFLVTIFLVSGLIAFAMSKFIG